MIKPLLSVFLLGALTLPISAHELWMERDGSGPVKIYLGEPDQGLLERGETIAALAPTTRFIIKDPAQHTPLDIRTDHLEANIIGDADLRVINEQVWQPWENDKGERTAALMHARWGRTETQAQMDFELVPVKANAERLILIFKGKPLPDTEVMLIKPDNQAQALKTNAQGEVKLSITSPGRYIIAAGHETPADGRIVAGEKVDRLYHGTTTSFAVQQ